MSRSSQALLIVTFAAGLWSQTPVAHCAERVNFATQIAPILEQHCIDCHGADDPESGFRLTSRQTTLHGGYSGKVVIPGDSQGSLLIKMVSGQQEDGVIMPPEGDTLTTAQITLFRNWIDEGAEWPKEFTIGPEASAATSDRSNHWAYQPIVKPPLPAVQDDRWVRQPLDAFVLHHIEQADVSPAPVADKNTLLRRVTLDLTGLPPTPTEVDQFLKDTSTDAYERVVDRLLNSPHYGERWARTWLDLCHFAESDGYLTDQLRPVAWRYRQWLIDALNRDLSFDQFTIQQLAGDLLPDATISQQIATGFLRQTLSNREGGADLEEFRVTQVLDRTTTMGTVWMGLTIGCAQCHDHKYDAVRQKEFYELNAFFDSADEINISAPLAGEAEPYFTAKATYDRKRAELIAPLKQQIERLQKRWEAKLLEAYHMPGQDYVWDRHWEVLGLAWGGGLGEGQLEGTQMVKLAWDQRSKDQQDRLFDYFLKHGAGTDPAEFSRLKLAALLAELEKLETDLPRPTRAPVMKGTQIPRTTHLFVRGDFRSPGIEVTPSTPGWLPPLQSDKSADRLALANWLMSDEHPLSARVIVNRVWQEFFGRGLVSTSADFGTQGERPTHPQLLDWLAWQYRTQGWGTKQLHRSIVTSATYRQSSAARPELADPDNKLLARQSSLRFSAEQVRDTVLAASGLLSRKIGGPSVFPPQPASVGMEGFDVTWKPSEGKDRYRRALYTFTRRQAPFAQSVTFDGADPSQSCTQRQRSNTPLQALTLLNDPVFFEAAQALATRVLKEAPPLFEERIRHLFLVCLARPPKSFEAERLEDYWQQQVDTLKRTQQSEQLIGSPEAVPNVTPAEAAAWTTLCSVILNLHEFITRE